MKYTNFVVNSRAGMTKVYVVKELWKENLHGKFDFYGTPIMHSPHTVFSINEKLSSIKVVVNMLTIDE